MMPAKEAVIHDDEPTGVDRLNREQYAKAFARISLTCDTPLVVGLYATWGVGKTSLMKLIEKELDQEKTCIIWFNLWEQQFNENPAVALAQAVAGTIGGKEKKQAKKYITLIAAAFGNRVLKSATGLNVFDVMKLGKTYEDENYQTRDYHLHLKEHFEALVKVARGSEGAEKRLIFFIDDLDRCVPDTALKLIEALKLYLNTEGCVYFIGVDREVLESSIKEHSGRPETMESDYLDKIIQLPFTIPLIEPSYMESFIEPILSEELQPCKDLLVEGLGDNPRHVKRFINILTFNHELARNMNIPAYDPKVLALLLLFQVLKPDLYREISHRPQLLADLQNKKSESQKLFEEFVEKDYRLAKIVKYLHHVSLGSDNVRYYMYLTRVSFGEEMGVDLGPIGPREKHVLIDRYVLWVDDKGLVGTEGIERELQKLGVSLTVVTSTEAAEARIREKKPDLIVSDIGRGRNYNAGFEMAEKFKKNGLFRGPLYFYAGDKGHGRIARADRLGAMIFVERNPLLQEIKEKLGMMDF